MMGAIICGIGSMHTCAPPTDDQALSAAREQLLGQAGMKIDETFVPQNDRRVGGSWDWRCFHIDAGWFPPAWGDWSAHPQKFPNGLAPRRRLCATRRGLKFGLWVGWTQGGIDKDPTGARPILNLFDPQQEELVPARLSTQLQAQ